METTITTKRGATLHVTVTDKGDITLEEFVYAGYRPDGVLYGKMSDGRPVEAATDNENSKIFLGIIAQAATFREDALESNVPGLSALREARDAAEEYREAINQMMDDESNDGVFPPEKPSSDPAAMAAEFPRAALYLKAEGYSCASNDRKASAGSRAMQILAEGGSEDEARAVLDNWLPASAYTD